MEIQPLGCKFLNLDVGAGFSTYSIELNFGNFNVKGYMGGIMANARFNNENGISYGIGASIEYNSYKRAIK